MKFQLNIIVAILFLSCGTHQRQDTTIVTQAKNNGHDIEAPDIPDFTDSLIVDGFDFPVGNPDGKGKYTSKTDGKVYDSWYIATKFAEKFSLGIHTGIDLNGSGLGNTDLGQPVYAIGKGIVVDAADFGAPWGNVVIIMHKYLENGHLQCCYSLYAHMEELRVKKGDTLQKRIRIGAIGTGGGSYPAHLHMEIRKAKMKEYDATYWPSSHSKDVDWVRDNYEDPKTFITKRRAITCPYREDKFIIAIKNKYTLYFFEKGILKNKYEIALSQRPIGHKEREGDLKLPEGEYYITGKQKGPFYGSFSEFLGSRLIRISYPNIYDAELGFQKRMITKKEKDDIIAANAKKCAPTKNTKLGGGIVIHGWKGEWFADGTQNLTWGCISMHNIDLEIFYDIVTLKTKIIITK